MNFDQLRQYKHQITEIGNKHGITRIYVFGSIVRGENNLHSDVDFLVEMQAGASLFGVAGFCYEVEQILGIPVDVIPLSVLPQVKDRQFTQNIQREAVAL